MQVGSRAEGARCTCSKTNPPPPPEGYVRDSEAYADVALHSLLPCGFFFSFVSSESLVGLGVPQQSHPSPQGNVPVRHT